MELTDNGVCEDGGDSAVFGFCALGMDCGDCGVRWDFLLNFAGLGLLTWAFSTPARLLARIVLEQSHSVTSCEGAHVLSLTLARWAFCPLLLTGCIVITLFRTNSAFEDCSGQAWSWLLTAALGVAAEFVLCFSLCAFNQ